MKNKLIALVEGAKRTDLPDFQVGDTVDVHQRILEGQKERIQIYSGVVIARRGEGVREMFTVRRIVQGEGVERVFPINSPKIAKIEVKRTGKVRRAKLFYLRDRVGKAVKLTEKRSGGGASGDGAARKAGGKTAADAEPGRAGAARELAASAT